MARETSGSGLATLLREGANVALPGVGGALVGGVLQAAPAIAGMKSLGGKAYRSELEKDLAKLKANKVKFSLAEKAQMAGPAAQALQAQTRAGAADIRRDAAKTGFGRSGAYQKGLAEIYKGGQGQMGAKMGEIEKLSTQTGLQEKARILQAAKEQRDKVASDWGKVVAGATKISGDLMSKAKAKQLGKAGTYGEEGVDVLEDEEEETE